MGGLLLALTMVLAGTDGGAARTSFLSGRLNAPETHEAVSAVSGGGRSFFLTRADEGFTTSEIFQVSIGADGRLALARPPFTTSSYDAGPAVSPDGRTVVFTSKRPSRTPSLPDDWNLWVTRIDEAGRWSEPRPLPPPINSGRADCCAVFAPSGALYFSSERDGTWDVFRSPSLEAASVEKLPEGVNSRFMEWPSHVSAGEDLLLFSSIRPQGAGGDDVWVSHRTGAGWGSPVNLGPAVNGPGFEDSAQLSPDSSRLVWSSRGSFGAASTSALYEIAADNVPALAPPAAAP